MRFSHSLFIFSFVATGIAAPVQTHRAPSNVAPTLSARYGMLPLSFEANLGQMDSRVKFVSRGSGFSLFLTENEAVLALRSDAAKTSASPFLTSRGAASSKGAEAAVKTGVVWMRLAQAAPGLKVVGEEELPGKANYFIGNDASKWSSGVPTYARVRYAGVYPGIDLVYYGKQRQLEYDFLVSPGADPGKVKIQFSGAKRLELDSAGDLVVVTGNGTLAFHKPVVYQSRTVQPGADQPQFTEKEAVKGRFVLLAEHTVGFSLGKYDRTRPVVIDPVLSYSTYLGGSNEDFASAIAVDADGDAYVTGYASSLNFPVTKGSYQTVNKDALSSGPNAFVTKLNPTGSSLIYSTYLGGDGGDAGIGIAVDAAGSAYVTGFAGSENFPVTHGTFETSHRTIFITKLDPSGSSLVYSTFLGGSLRDDSTAIFVDALGNAYLTGAANSTDFPVTPNAFQKVNRGQSNFATNAFLTKLNPAGTALVYSTYLGGSGQLSGDTGGGIAVDGAGDAYVTGFTGSKDFPVTLGAFQSSVKNEGAFVSKLNPSGSGLVYSTYLAGSGFGDSGNGITVDAAGDAYVTGSAASKDFPVTKGAFQTINSSERSVAFVSELNPAGAGLVYSTYLGGTTEDVGSGIAIDTAGRAYLTGFTLSSDFPITKCAFQKVNRGAHHAVENTFLSALNASGSELDYSTYFGGSGSDDGAGNYFGDDGVGIALDQAGNVYLAGYATSTNFPVTSGAFQTVNNGAANFAANAFIARFSFAKSPVLPPSTVGLVSDSQAQRLGVKVTFTAAVTTKSISGIPTGTISFVIDGRTGPVVELDDTGHASYVTSSLAEGVHHVSATYSGDEGHAPATSSAIHETIYGPPAGISSLQGHGQTAVYGTAYESRLVLQVNDEKGDPVPGAIVSFSGAGLTFSPASVVTDALGVASSEATPTAVGTITATASIIGVTRSEIYALTATKAPLSVIATSLTVPFGDTIPPLTYALSGFVNGDDSSAVTGEPCETTPAQQWTPVGTYPIAISQCLLVAKNYSLVFMNGTVKIMATIVSALPGATGAAQ